MNIKRNAFPLVSDVATEETMLFNVHQKKPLSTIVNFPQFYTIFYKF